MDDIPVLGWVGIFCIGVVVIVMNVGLVGLLRYRPTTKMSAKDQPASRTARDWQRMGNFVGVLRDPFAQSRGQMEELAREVKNLPRDTGEQSATKDQS